MSLDKENAIRWEWYENSRGRSRIYIFACSNCKNECRSKPSYFSKHSGLCIKCSSKITIKKAQEFNKLRPYEAKFNIFKYKCPETNLIYEDYLTFIGTNCNYCEKILNWQPFGENNPGFWLDRKDSKLGHIKGNLVTCCGNCNFTKTDKFTYEEFMLLAPILKQIRLNREL